MSEREATWMERVCIDSRRTMVTGRASLRVRSASLILGGIVGLAVGAGAVLLLGSSGSRLAGPEEGSAGALASDFVAPFGILREAHADLEEGTYDFFPNRRSVWIVNRDNGRMANYHFRDDEVGSVDRSRVAQIDLNTFPRKDTVLILSDRNLNNILWCCNVRTGDVQMWYPGRDGTLRSEMPIASSADLRPKNP